MHAERMHGEMPKIFCISLELNVITSKNSQMEYRFLDMQLCFQAAVFQMFSGLYVLKSQKM